ncbi:hypothetical protein TraAM80_10144 [Trypanosoma rangeli]|uniref:Mucin-like glycoprotein n=1 Tax=Trypanosoma rangeli TaxID=5698 RepID=A0A3R7JUT4_TRYRA|nr:uncharacterized protein TraAM80_10144 [Trypanosoma rangeli]RNE95819.1 hypothetical protein TraAM80_10144 [Trypanosoma rangeli]|eukprot:RNE95819.1 hypothetical protein TraAM80_10144 [Trypanosoma rangeli]
MAMATVQCRAVCALAVFALLCGCFSSVCGEEASKVKVSAGVQLQVTCPTTVKPTQWYFSGSRTIEWISCSGATGGSVSTSAKDEIGERICIWAILLYNDTLLKQCTTSDRRLLVHRVPWSV